MEQERAAVERAGTFSWMWAAIAAAVWAASTFGHGQGLEWAGDLFRWAQRPGSLHPDGGPAGLVRLELALVAVCGVAAALVGAVCLRRALRAQPSGRQWVEALVPWGLWAALVWVVYTWLIVYATEFAHFGQYALVGSLWCMAFGRGRDPQAAFLVTAALGFTDELYQHYLLHMGDADHWMDWSDPVLDMLGAAAGILPFVTLGRLEGWSFPDTYARLRRAFALSALALLPLLLLSDVDHARYLGSYRIGPYWTEYQNGKPTHWPAPGEGIPLVLGALLVVGTLVEPRRRKLSQAGLLVLVVLVGLAIDPARRGEPRPLHAEVPTVRAARAEVAPVIDGALDEAVWERAERLGPFRDGRTGEDAHRGEALHATYARVAWDQGALYVAFEVHDPDPWGRALEDDTRSLPADEVVEVFVDDLGDELTYYEFEVSPLGVIYDLFCLIPDLPVDHDPWARFLPLPQWDAEGFEVGIQFWEGTTPDTLSETAGVLTEGREQSGGGYTVELAIPWSNFSTATTPSALTRLKLPPKPGQRWRLGLYRVERPRLTAEEVAVLHEPWVDRARARALFGDPEEFDRLDARGGFVHPEDDPERYQPANLLSRRQSQRAQYQAWSPPFNASFHKPGKFGVLEFDE